MRVCFICAGKVARISFKDARDLQNLACNLQKGKPNLQHVARKECTFPPCLHVCWLHVSLLHVSCLHIRTTLTGVTTTLTRVSTTLTRVTTTLTCVSTTLTRVTYLFFAVFAIVKFKFKIQKFKFHILFHNSRTAQPILLKLILVIVNNNCYTLHSAWTRISLKLI